MDNEHKRKMTMFVIKEVKEYVCYCGMNGMDFSKIHFDSKYTTKVDLKCKDKDCDHTRQVQMNYSEEMYD